MGLLVELELLKGRGLLGPEVARAVLRLGTQLQQGLVHRAHGGLLGRPRGADRQEAAQAKAAAQAKEARHNVG